MCAGSLMLHAGFSGCGKWGCSQAVVRRLLIAVVSLVAEHGLQGTGSVVVGHRLSCPTAGGVFPDQGANPCPPALAGRFLTTGLPGKSMKVKILASSSCCSQLWTFLLPGVHLPMSGDIVGCHN